MLNCAAILSSKPVFKDSPSCVPRTCFERFNSPIQVRNDCCQRQTEHVFAEQQFFFGNVVCGRLTANYTCSPQKAAFLQALQWEYELSE